MKITTVVQHKYLDLYFGFGSIWYVVDDYQTNVQTTQIELQEIKSQLHTINNSLDSISTKQDK